MASNRANPRDRQDVERMAGGRVRKMVVPKGETVVTTSKGGCKGFLTLLSDWAYGFFRRGLQESSCSTRREEGPRPPWGTRLKIGNCRGFADRHGHRKSPVVAIA